MIICDVDGCLLDLIVVFASWWNERNELKLPTEAPAWDFGLKGEDRDKMWVGLNEFFDTELAGNLPFYSSDIKEYFNKLAEHYGIHIVTSFPEKSAAKRIRNLAGFDYSSITFMKGHPAEKVNLIEELKPKAVIEDYPGLVRNLASKGFKVYFPRYKYTECLRDVGEEYSSGRELYEKIVRE